VGVGTAVDNVLDIELKLMAMDDVVLNDKTKREMDRLLAQIGRADSMIVAVKACTG
jgi:hypothetical protein